MNLCLKNSKACLLFLFIGVILAFFSLTPKGSYLEEEIGLPVLFKLRGEIPPPDNVIIVSIDELSARILHLPDDPEKWPRTYYAQLINKINQQSPSIIAFNMTFGEKREAKNDQLLAQAIANDHNIILSNYLKRQTIQSTGTFSQFKFERIISPIPVIEDAALTTAPFLLPKTATTVKQFWAYKNSAGDVATFPVTIFQHYLFKKVYTEIADLLYPLDPEYKTAFPVKADQHSDENIQNIKLLLANNPQHIDSLKKSLALEDYSTEKKQLLFAWLSLLKQPNSLYFNYYGKAETIPTIPFYQALVSDILKPDLFTNKIVLVGYSKTIEPERSSGLYTVFSKTDYDIISPIEIAATAVANLLENTWLKPLQTTDQFFLIIVWSILLSAISRLRSFLHRFCLLIIVTLIYLACAYLQFVSNAIWIPLFIPLMVQIPLILTFISIDHFLKGKQEHQNMHQAFSLYVPDSVVNSMSQQSHSTTAMKHFGEQLHGICMATDAGQYTTLSENMEPQKLHQLINHYYGVMFPIVKNNQGIISDVVGDAMFAIWGGADKELQIKTNACLAALQIKKAVEVFNQSQPYHLPTRLGLNYGSFLLGNVGAAEHYEYRAVGDTVNTAARIEGLNKLLGTQILVTSELIDDLPYFLTREIGFFILKGKTQSVHIYELISTTDSHYSQQSLLAEFSAALKLFQHQQWAEALAKWQDIELRYPTDGPTLFYIQYLTQNIHSFSLKTSAKSQSTVIKIGNITTPLLLDD